MRVSGSETKSVKHISRYERSKIVSSFKTSIKVANLDSSGDHQSRRMIMKMEIIMRMASWAQRKFPKKSALSTKVILLRKKLRGTAIIHIVGLSYLTLVP